MALAHLPKGILLGSKNSNTEFTIFGQKQVHLLRTTHATPHLSFSTPLFCPSPFLCFPSALRCTLSKYLEGLFCRGFAYDSCECQQAWQQTDLRQKNKSSPQEGKDIFLYRQPWKASSAISVYFWTALPGCA